MYLSDVSGAIFEVRTHVDGKEDVVIETQLAKSDQRGRPAEGAMVPAVTLDDWPTAKFNDILDERCCLVVVDVCCREKHRHLMHNESVRFKAFLHWFMH